MSNSARDSKPAKVAAKAAEVEGAESLPKATKPTRRVLEAFLENPTEERHGFDLLEPTKLKSGSLYPILIRLQKLGWLKRRWEEDDEPGARRRLYALTAEGEPAARRFIAEAKARDAAPSAGHLRGRRPAGESLA